MRLIKDKKVNKNCQNNFLNFFPKGKKGMEMWQIVLIILALVLLLLVIAWYSGLSGEMSKLLEKFSNKL